jgi:hypothetical protein
VALAGRTHVLIFTISGLSTDVFLSSGPDLKKIEKLPTHLTAAATVSG